MAFMTTNILLVYLLTQSSLLSVALQLMLLSIIISVMMASLMSFSWVFYITTLVYAGGVMLLFSYMASLMQGKEPLKVSPPLNNRSYLTFFLGTMVYLVNQPFTPLSSNWSLTVIYTNMFSPIVLFLAIYILFLLITSMKLSLSSNGPLKLNL